MVVVLRVITRAQADSGAGDVKFLENERACIIEVIVVDGVLRLAAPLIWLNQATHCFRAFPAAQRLAQIDTTTHGGHFGHDAHGDFWGR